MNDCDEFDEEFKLQAPINKSTKGNEEWVQRDSDIPKDIDE